MMDRWEIKLDDEWHIEVQHLGMGMATVSLRKLLHVERSWLARPRWLYRTINRAIEHHRRLLKERSNIGRLMDEWRGWHGGGS